MNKSGYLPIEQEVARQLQENFGEESPKFILAVSGGPDSMALLYLFYKLGVEALAVHINYGKRGEEADKDAELVEQMAHQWDFECQTISAKPQQGEAGNFQQWARHFRYEVFRSLAGEYDARGIALAHHQDDQVETILQKLFRGAGLESWSAMQVWDGELFRPLLHISREQIEAYCEEHAIPFRIDRTNINTEFARNFLRNEWLVKLDDYFPGWKKNVLRIPGQAALFSKALRWISDSITDDRGRISRNAFLDLDGDLAQALLLNRVKKMDPDLEISRDALKQLQDIEKLQTGKSLQLSDSWFLLRDRDWFKIVYERSVDLKVVQLETESLQKKPFRYNGLEFMLEAYDNPDFENALYLDAEKMTWPLTIREWKSGDTFQPLGMQGHQKISDHLTNRKVSAARKKSALVVVSFDETICAVIFPPIENRRPPGTIAETVKCDRSTGNCLKIK